MLDERYFKKIKEITVPEYIMKIKLSESQRTKYFHKSSGTGKTKKTLNKIPKKYKAVGFDLLGFAITTSGERIISNPQAAGTNKFAAINGQLFYAGKGGHFTRNKIVRELHLYYEEILKDHKPFQPNEYPIIIQMNWFLPYSHQTPDNFNNAFAYLKAFEDTLTEMKIIPDDEVRYVPGTFPIYTPCEKLEDRKIVFTFWTDNRAEIQQFKLL